MMELGRPSPAGLEALERDADRFYGKYRGLVFDNADPLGVGRLRARVPEVLGTVPTGWALPCAAYAGDGSGLYAVPARDAGVWIEFEAGDTSRPVWTGAWWGELEVPLDHAATPSEPSRKILRSESGLMVSLDDFEHTISISDSEGNNLISLRMRDGTIEMRSTRRVILEAPEIDHGRGATHPAVFGDDLLTYLNQLVAIFNAHVHPGETAIGVLPVTPTVPLVHFPQAQPSLISTKNIVE
jgi:Type VI secretion system/phage-baseplate injector OB domain